MFLEHCNPEAVKECDELFEALCRKYATVMTEAGPAACIRASRVLLAAFTIRTRLESLSVVHTDLLQGSFSLVSSL